MKLFDSPKSVIDSVKDVMEKKMSKAELAAMGGDKEKVDAEDFEALRAGKHKKKKHHVKEEEVLDERNKENKFKKDLNTVKAAIDFDKKNLGMTPDDFMKVSKDFGDDHDKSRDGMKSLIKSYKRTGRKLAKEEAEAVEEGVGVSNRTRKTILAVAKTMKDDNDHNISKNVLNKLTRNKEAGKTYDTARKMVANEEVEVVDEAKDDSTWGVDSPKRKKSQYVSDDGRHVAKIHKKEGEFIVSIHSDGKHHEPADYFTDDKEDAHGTAKAMLAHAVKHAKPLKEETSLVSKIINKYTK